MKPPHGFGKAVNEYLNHYVTVADTKAAGVLTADIAFAGYLVAKVPTAVTPLIFHWVALMLFLASGFMAISTLFPRTPKIGSSLIFWEDIRARANLETYLKDLSQTDEAEIERQYGAQNYLVSSVLSRKFVCVRWAMRTLMVAIPFTLLKIAIGE